MYVIEVKPKESWRPIRLEKKSLHSATLPPQHRQASHFFMAPTVESLMRTGIRLYSAGRKLVLPEEHWRVIECACRPDSLR